MNSLRIGDLGFVTACYESSACQRIKEYACLLFAGRHDTAGTATQGDAQAFLIGPEGGGGLI